MTQRAARQSGTRNGTVRIIGGAWRGRKLTVGQQPGLRPTADRTRETLFNWLQSATPGARVLDLFAGSGALGFEALSRGAAQATLVEKHPATADTLRKQAQILGAQSCRVVCADGIAWLNGLSEADESCFDLVFLDPPFDTELLPVAVQILEQGAHLPDGAVIYAEFSAGDAPAAWPPSWKELRRTRSREAECILFRREAPQQGEQL